MRIELCADPGRSMSEGRISALPILLLNVHESCNCRCVMCDIWKRKDGAELDLSRFTRHRESIRALGVRHVVLTGGEPLLHGRFNDLCSFLKDCGVRLTLLTTGLLLAKRSASVAENIDEVIVSLDGPEEIHDRIRRVPGGYRLIREGIEKVRDLNPALLFHCRSTVQKANHACLRQTAAAARVLGLNSISFLAADAKSQAFNRELIWPDDRQNHIMLTPAEVAALEIEVENMIRENASDIRAGFIREDESRLRRIVRRFREHLGELNPVAPQCNAPWKSAVLEVDGSIRPCFFHPIVGNAHEQTLEEAVNSAAARQFRASLRISDDPICSRCVCSLNFRG